MPRKGKCKIKIVPGPTGPTGPTGPPAVALTKRVLKVQLEGGLPAPNLIEGFKYEATVEPPDWPVAGDFIFFRAEVLDTPGYAMGESFSVVASLVYGDSVPITKNQLVIAHLDRNEKIIAYHSAVSEIVGLEDYLIAQSIQDAAVGDFFYVAISPDTTDLLNFNHNLASLQTIPAERSFSIPGDLPIDVEPSESNPKIAGDYVACVTTDSEIFINLFAGSGGAGAGGTSTNSGGGTYTLGTGGGGGNGGLAFNKPAGPPDPSDGPQPPPTKVKAGDVLTWTIGSGGTGGANGGDGQDGLASCIMLNRSLVPATDGFFGVNPVPGGKGGKSGDNGGGSPDTVTGPPEFNCCMGGTGGGGGGSVVNGSSNFGGVAGVAFAFYGGENGSSNPRDGGDGGAGSMGMSNSSTGGTGGSFAGPTTSNFGAGGGGGGVGPLFISSGSGGNGSAPGTPANPGSDGIMMTSGGSAGGSAGLPDIGATVIGGNGGRGADGGIIIGVNPLSCSSGF